MNTANPAAESPKAVADLFSLVGEAAVQQLAGQSSQVAAIRHWVAQRKAGPLKQLLLEHAAGLGNNERGRACWRLVDATRLLEFIGKEGSDYHQVTRQAVQDWVCFLIRPYPK